MLTDFLVRSFERTVIAELGLDRHPELRDDYFAHYTRVVWLAQQPDDELRALRGAAAARLGLPLTVVPTGRRRPRARARRRPVAELSAQPPWPNRLPRRRLRSTGISRSR